MKISFKRVSGNSKVGPIPVSTSSKNTCPASCPLNNSNVGGCYAAAGPVAIHWNRLTNGVKNYGIEYDEFYAEVKALRKGTLWRHNVAGDLFGEGETVDATELKKLVDANTGKRGFTYTHKHNLASNIPLLAEANEKGFTVNLSANNLSHAETLVGKGCPVVSVLPLEYQRKHDKSGAWLETEAEFKTRIAALPQYLKSGQKVVVCPATYRDDMTCQVCGFCQNAKRSAVVGFPVHGTRKLTAQKVTEG